MQMIDLYVQTVVDRDYWPAVFRCITVAAAYIPLVKQSLVLQFFNPTHLVVWKYQAISKYHVLPPTGSKDNNLGNVIRC